MTWIIRQSLMEETAMPIEMTFDKRSDQNVQNNMGAQERERLTLWGVGRSPDRLHRRGEPWSSTKSMRGIHLEQGCGRSGRL